MSKKRAIALVTLGSIGDLLPFLAVARELRRRGRDVIIATHTEYEPLCRMLGLEFRAIWDGRDTKDIFQGLLTASPAETWARVWNEFFVPATGPTRAAVTEIARERQCTFVAAWSALGARAACEELHVPLRSVYLSPAAFLAEAELTPEAGRHAGGASRSAPASSLGDGSGVSSRLGFFPSWFWEPPSDPKRMVTTGFPLHDDALVPFSLSKLRQFLDAGEAPVVFTPGSFMTAAGPFFSDALEACARLGRRALFLTPHREQIPPHLPSTALHLDYVPLHRILGRAAAFFHHGGIGTCAQAMRAGVPQVVTPLFFDQFDNADQLERLAVGFRLDRDAVDASSIADALEKSLSSGSAKDRAAVSARFRGEDSVDAICERVEVLD
jgi:rhamnosyltransferase subunit B